MSPELQSRTERDAARWHHLSMLWLIIAVHSAFFSLTLIRRGDSWAIAAMVAAVTTSRVSVLFFRKACRALDSIQGDQLQLVWRRVKTTRTEAEPDEAR